MRRRWLTVNGEIIDMEETPPAPAKRPRRRLSVEAFAVVIAIGCILLELGLGIYSMTHYGFLSGVPFHIATVVMAAMLWGAVKPEGS